MAKKILFIIDQMAQGGAARVTSTLLPGLLAKGYDVVMAFDYVNSKQFYDIPDGVNVIPFEAKRKGVKFVKQIVLIREARRIIRDVRPDLIVAVTFFPFFYAYFGNLRTGIPLIAYDHTSFGRNMGLFVNFIRFHLYGCADKVVILTKKDSDLLGDRLPEKVVIYNPLTYPIKYEAKENRQKVVLCAGRLDSWHIKGIDRILDIWSRVSQIHTDWKLLIAGGGDDESLATIKSMIEKNSIKKSVVLLGQISDMPLLYAATSIFALPSRVEGFPMVLLEAMSQGCACVAFEMEGAVNEMMSVASGEIVPDGNLGRFEAALNKLISMHPNYSDIQVSAFKDVERFSCDEFYNHWDNTIKHTINTSEI